MVKPRKIVFQLLAIVLFCETSELENQGEWYNTTSFLLLLYTVKEKLQMLKAVNTVKNILWEYKLKTLILVCQKALLLKHVKCTLYNNGFYF